MTDHPVASRPAPPVPLPLHTLAEQAEQAGGASAVIRLDYATDALIVGTNPDGVDLILVPSSASDATPQATTTTTPGAIMATLIIDSARQARVLRHALPVLVQQAATERAAVAKLRDQHAQTLAEIRDYAIERHMDDEICRSGLDKFLAHFGLGAYEPRLRVTYTITGSYEVEDTDADQAERDAKGWLRPDFGDISCFAGAGERTVTVTGVEKLGA